MRIYLLFRDPCCDNEWMRKEKTPGDYTGCEWKCSIYILADTRGCVTRWENAHDLLQLMHIGLDNITNSWFQHYEIACTYLEIRGSLLLAHQPCDIKITSNVAQAPLLVSLWGFPPFIMANGATNLYWHAAFTYLCICDTHLLGAKRHVCK